MPLSSDISLYEDLRPHLDQALASPRGIRITVHSRGAAIHLRQRIYQLRKLEKLASADVYPPGDERRGRTAYDNLTATVVGETVLVEPVIPQKVEEL